MQRMTSVITLRPPTFSSASSPPNYQTPAIPWLMEEWHVTHSTLPMWKGMRNVRIKYSPLEPSSASISKDSTDRVDDLVTYQKIKNDKLHVVKGVDSASSQDSRGEWNWRGRGMLKIASSHWEVLGWGEEAETGNKWVVTMFAKTLFTPAGIDVYSKHRDGLKEQTVSDIKTALAGLSDSSVTKLADELFEVRIDDARKE